MLQKQDALSLSEAALIPPLALNTHQARLGHTQQAAQLAPQLQDRTHQILLIRPIPVLTATSMALVLLVLRDSARALDQASAQQIKAHLDGIQLLHQNLDMETI